MSIDPVSKSPRTEHRRQSLPALLRMRRFAPLLLLQALGVFNDQLFKAALLVWLASQATGDTKMGPGPLLPLAVAFYLFPIVVFSATAGQLADKYDKAALARLLKILETLAMGIAALGFLWHSTGVLLGALCLLGLHATLFTPTNYAILPQHLRADELVGGNALFAVASLVALLAGSVAGTLLAGVGAHWVAVSAISVAASGLLVSLCLPNAPASAPGLRVGLNPVGETWRNIGLARQNRVVFFAILGMAWLCFCAALLLARIPAYSSHALGVGDGLLIFLLATFTAGIGVGSMLCERLSDKPLEFGLAPFGAMGLALFALALLLTLPAGAALGAPLGEARFWLMAVELGALGIFAGLYLVPLNVLIQSHSAPAQRARILSVSSLLNALSLVAGTSLAAALPGREAAFPWLLGTVALGFVGMAAWAYAQAPHPSLRFFADLLIRSFYRLEKTGFAHIPETGPAVLVCNHVSFVDSVVIMAAVRRPIRFVIDHRIHRTPFAHVIFRHARTIPIATAKDNIALKEAAFDEVARALKNGELIGLFPEGAITRTGEIRHFRYGVGRIVGETPVPVIPMALRGLWGSFFSRRYGPAMSKPSLLRPFARIELVVGEPVPAEQATPEYLQEIVTGLRGGLV